MVKLIDIDDISDSWYLLLSRYALIVADCIIRETTNNVLDNISFFRD